MRSNEEAENGWETKSNESRYADAHLELVLEKVKTPSRAESKAWTTVYRKSAVVIAAMTRDGRFLLIRQERIPVRTALWEMPAGQIDKAGVPTQREIEETARRELREETGYVLAQGGEIIPLGDFFTSPGFTNERCYLLLARPVERGTEGRDQEELIVDCREFSPNELQRMIQENEIRDANTLSIYARLLARGFLALDPS